MAVPFTVHMYESTGQNYSLMKSITVGALVRQVYMHIAQERLYISQGLIYCDEKHLLCSFRGNLAPLVLATCGHP